MKVSIHEKLFRQPHFIKRNSASETSGTGETGETGGSASRTGKYVRRVGQVGQVGRVGLLGGLRRLGDKCSVCELIDKNNFISLRQNNQN